MHGDDAIPAEEAGCAAFTRRLVLRRLDPADVPDIARLAGDRELAAMTAAIPHPYGEADALAFVEAGLSGANLVCALACRATGRFLGVASLSAPDAGGASELGYWIGRPDWGRGYATEAAQAMVDIAFTHLTVHRVTASCRVINRASRRVLEKCGFQMRRLGFIDSKVGGRVSAECWELDRGAFQALKAWSRPGLAVAVAAADAQGAASASCGGGRP